MTTHGAIAELVRCAGAFGREPAERKLRLLERISVGGRVSARDLRALHDLLCFLQAYPDNRAVLRAVRSVVAKLRPWRVEQGIDPDSPSLENEGFPGAVNRYEFSLPLLERLVPRLRGCFDVDWSELDDPNAIVNALSLLVTSAECQGLDDIDLDLRDWFEASRPARYATDLEFLISLFEAGSLAASTRDHVYESCAVPIRFEMASPGTARSELVRDVDSVCYQRRDLDRSRSSLASAARRPFGDGRLLGPAAGEELIHLAQRALCARSLEIRTLSYANARDVTLVSCGRGLEIALIGVVPQYRDPLECHYCSLVLKNGVPIAYGPGTVSLGCCEIGLNLFPEFRGAEVRYIYPQFVRTLYQLLGARYFFLTPYGMGRDNPAAIRTGAFWFYRKLGFRPNDPDIEAIARGEERRMRDNPGYRSSRATLLRMSHTSAYLDLSGGECHPLDLGATGLRQSRFIGEIAGGDRHRALEASTRRVARSLGLPKANYETPGERRSWEMLAPLLAMIPDLADWGSRDKQRLLKILRLKGAPTERRVDALIRSHRPLCDALRAISDPAAAPSAQ